MSGSISHAHLGAEELAFVFELCEATGWFIINQQGGGDKPLVLFTPRSAGATGDLWASDIPTCDIASPSELEAALTSSFESFLAFKQRVLEGIVE